MRTAATRFTLTADAVRTAAAELRRLAALAEAAVSDTLAKADTILAQAGTVATATRPPETRAFDFVSLDEVLPIADDLARAIRVVAG